MSENPGRDKLGSWRDSKPSNFYDSNPNLRSVIETIVGRTAAAAIEPGLRAFGAVAATDLEPLVADCERLENLPVLRRWSGIGERTEEIEFHPSYREAGRAAWKHGIIAIQAEPGRTVEQGAMIYLLAHQGEGGHACPVACTAGLVRALQTHASDGVRARFLPPLLERHWDDAQIGAQFLTEVQGGSDVGANLIEAAPDRDSEGGWRITGEKWFCSVANADQFLMTARVRGAGGGTGGLGTFVVPRRLCDGTLNGFAIRRLKNKLGTRAMASAEIDFDGADAYPIGNVREGFKIAVGVVLNTSRWINALGSTGLMRRAYVEALHYAAHRSAFGGPIGRYPLVRETLARMKCEEAAALSSTFYLSRLIDRIDEGTADAHQKAVYRLLVNANKYITSIAAAEVTHDALEVFGGNGAIEDFSVVPRILRDNFVFESWEGAHNVLVMQVLRDSAKLGLFGNLQDEINTELESLQDPDLRADGAQVAEAVSALGARVSRSLADGTFGATHFRRQLGDMMRAFQTVRLLVEADRGSSDGRAEKSAIAAFFLRRHLMPRYDPELDAAWAERIDAVLGGDLEAAQR